MVELLLIEREKLVIDLLVDYLKDKKINITAVIDEQEAVKLIRSKKVFDVVLSNLVMPVLSGIEILKECNKKNSSIQFIIMTGHPSIETISEALDLGAFCYITKPIERMELSHVIDKAIEKKKLLDENQFYKKSLEEKVKDRTAKLSKTVAELELFKYCFHQSNDAKVILTHDRKIKDVNLQFEKVTGFKKKEVKGKTMSVLRSDYFEKEFYQNLWSEVEEKGSWVGDIINRKKNGEVYQTRFSLGPVKGKKSKGRYYIGTFMRIDSSSGEKNSKSC
ncbi:MAG: response regulator [Nitrospinae bacterium]|nr:response regulator [Nitrospinota bacterium]